jgi:hypothetical protein
VAASEGWPPTGPAPVSRVVLLARSRGPACPYSYS